MNLEKVIPLSAQIILFLIFSRRARLEKEI